MEKTIHECEEKEKVPRPSSYPEFADIFSFLQHFGKELGVPDVTLSALEEFFINGDASNTEDTVAVIHYTLVKKGVRRAAAKDNWTATAVKFAYSKGVVGVASDYDDLNCHERLKLLQLLCEVQFERNTDFKNCIAKYPDDGWRDRPVGLDKLGCRYWLLQDSCHEIRLYVEDKYTEHPYGLPVWNLLCSSVEELQAFVEARKTSSDLTGSDELSEEDRGIAGEVGKRDEVEPDRVEETHKKSRLKGGRRSKRGREKEKCTSGCILCLKDTNYTKMLLCDGCNAECHMYCQYPVLWNVPEGDWFCPNCRQSQLAVALEETLASLLAAKEAKLKATEMQQRRMRSLARGGMLLQNIITDQSGCQDDVVERRSSRARKVVNYAELNEPHIPQLHSRAFLYLPNHLPPRTRKTRQNWNDEDDEEREEKEIKQSHVDVCQLFVSTEYKGDQENWIEKENKPSVDLLEQEDEEEDELRMELVCRLPVLQWSGLQCQQMTQKPEQSCEALPFSDTPALETILSPPLSPPLPPPPHPAVDKSQPHQTNSVLSDHPAAVSGNLSTWHLTSRQDRFSSCSGGSLYRMLEDSSRMEGSGGGDPLQVAAGVDTPTHLHCTTVPEDYMQTDQQSL